MKYLHNETIDEIKRLGFELVEDRREIDMVVIKLRENDVD